MLCFFPLVVSIAWYSKFGLGGLAFGYLGLFAAIGPMMISRALRHRSGDSLHCPRCDYEAATSEASLDKVPEWCPECGFGWEHFLVRGRIKPSSKRAMLWAFVTMTGILIGATGLANSIERLVKFVPTFMLVESVVRGDGKGGPLSSLDFIKQWQELATRTLSSQQSERLATMLVERVGKSPIDIFQSLWLKQAFGAKTLPVALLDKYLERRITSEAILAPPAENGDRVFVLRVVDHDDPGFGTFFTVLAECRIEPSGVLLATNAGWYRPRMMFPRTDEDNRQSFIATGPSIGAPRPSLRIPIPAKVLAEARERGDAVIRAKVWIFFSPGVFVGSRVAPADLIANPALDARARLFRTVELEARLESGSPPAKDTGDSGH